MISYFYKRTLPIIIMLVTSASVAWSASYTEAIRETRNLSMREYMLNKSFRRFAEPLLDNSLYKQTLDIIIISKDRLLKDHKNVKEIIFEEKRKEKRNNESKAEISLNEQVIAAFPEINFIYFDLSTDDEKRNNKKFIFNTFDYLEYMVCQNNSKNFIIYMDFNVKYEKELYAFMKDKFRKFKDNSIIITNTELGDYPYEYKGINFMIPAFIKDEHVLMVGPENVKIDSEKLRIDEADLSPEKIEAEKFTIADILKDKFINNTDIKFKQFQNQYTEQKIDAERIPIEATKEYFITNGINSHYAALQCCIMTALAWLINCDFSNTKLIKKIKNTYTTDKVFDFTKFITYIEKKDFKEKVNLNLPETSERKIIYFELNDYSHKKFPKIGKLKIRLNNQYKIEITGDGVSLMLRGNSTPIKKLVWNGVEENKGESYNEGFGHNNKVNKDTFSCQMTLKKDEINLKIDDSHYKFEKIDYGYNKINKILLKQKNVARNFKNIINLAPKDEVLKKIKTGGNNNINVDDIKYEKSVAVLFIVNKFQETDFSEYHDNIQKLIEKLSAQGFDVKILTGEKATLLNLLELFEKIKLDSKDKLTRLFFYYFGHMKETINKEDFSKDLSLTCYTGYDEENANLWSMVDVKNVLNGLNFRHTAVLIDSCFSSNLKIESLFLDSDNPIDPSYFMITASKKEIYARALLAVAFLKSLNGTESPYSIDEIYRVIKEDADKAICDIKNNVNTENRESDKLCIDPSIYKYKKGNFFFNKCNDVNKNININGKDVPRDEFKL